MKTLVIGATGATGKKLVDALLSKGQAVTVIVRSPEKCPKSWNTNSLVNIIRASVSEISESEMEEYVRDCTSVVSCLGHNLSWKGIYGKPRRLVTDSIACLCNAIQNKKPQKPVKFVLLNTTGNRNRDLNESISWSEKFMVGLIRLLLPPHADNEKAADYLRTKIGQNNNYIEWVAVRPDSLIDEVEVSEYVVYPSPIRSAIFDAGKTSRINVADFMSELIVRNDTWIKWKGQMPVIYNQ